MTLCSVDHDKQHEKLMKQRERKTSKDYEKQKTEKCDNVWSGRHQICCAPNVLQRLRIQAYLSESPTTHLQKISTHRLQDLQ